ncbi:sigma-54-dependent Fis family transcriptional regulator [Ammoniphilus sp. CFH 90114]|uniref:sigma-54 interaction domain-containing protein n=1 Tax=Ammoniphilus sp. CFH 90114 TaxID=2493665 RepID=UPI00100F7FEC|nr:sigma 54-interacting transcriptional regulator [Ammoniphilus sp. CFH 90114]RXT04274.1 PAS domain S-box protein [Ammoniphilus sp. CFH 90114]
MEKTWKQWTSQFEWILNIINVGVHMVDKQGETVFYNETMAGIDGLKREEVLGRNIFQLYPSLTDETSTLYLALTKGTETAETIQTYVNLQGKTVTSINSTYPLYEEGEIIGAVELAKDITNVMTMYDQILDLRQQLVESRKKNKPASGSADYHFSDMIGESAAFGQAISIAKKAARTHSPVMICGPTGTGKELVAQSIHNASIRRDEAFIAQNCAAVPKELMEGLLFGTTKGAFTGAIDRPGIFEQANGGTLFLDELNSLELSLQAKLLRVLQEGKVRRIGAASEQEVDVRIIAAMNAPVQEVLDQGVLRSDLFFRLNVVYVQLPSLQERKEDIPLLVNHFIQKFNRLFGSHVRLISDKALDRLLHYSWPGNIRELGHAIESAFNIMDIGYDVIEEHHLPHQLFDASIRQVPVTNRLQRPKGNIDLPNMIEEFERDTIVGVLEECKGNISKTAEALGLKRQALQYKLNKYGISKGN